MILVTGAAGYIGSHICKKLLESNKDIVCIDNLGKTNNYNIEYLINTYSNKIYFYKIDLQNSEEVSKIFSMHNIECVIHLAGFKSINESSLCPDIYYRNNLDSTLSLLSVMKDYGCNKIIFSSSAAVYGDGIPPFDEKTPLKPLNTYAHTKCIIEKIILLIPDINAIIFRYFNPVGVSNYLKDPCTSPENLFPIILEVITGKRDILKIYGDDHNTPDGSCIRDYIHIDDLVDGHISAVNLIKNFSGVEIFNLGTGKGISVFEIINEFEKQGHKINFSIEKSRPGEADICYSTCNKAANLLNFKTKYSLSDMVSSYFEVKK